MDVIKEEHVKLRHKIEVDVVAEKEQEKENEVIDNTTSVLRTPHSYPVHEVESEYLPMLRSHHSLVVVRIVVTRLLKTLGCKPLRWHHILE